MPNIPHFDDDIPLHPGGAAEVSPNAMAAPGAATARAGDVLGDQMAEFNDRYQNARMAADTAHTNAQVVGAMDDIQHKWSIVPDRTQAQAGFDQDVAALRTKTLQGISNPFVQSQVSQTFDRESAVRRNGTANAAFQQESSMRNGQLVQDNALLAQSAASATDDNTRARIQEQAMQGIDAHVQAGWLLPQAGAEMKLKFNSNVQENRVRGLMNNVLNNQDGDGARQLSTFLGDPNNLPGLEQKDREVMQTRLENLTYRLDQRATAQQAHADAMAEKNLHQAQAHNEAVMLAGIVNGQTVTPAQIQKMADGQQISAGGVEALTSASKSQENGIDDPTSTLRLWHAIGTHTASSDMIFDAMNTRQVSRNTAVSMMKSLDASSGKLQDQTVRNAYGQLKTALHGGAVEQGIIPDKAPEAAMWAQAQGEWHQRIGAGEAPAQVLPDMLKRYGSNTAAPTWLAQPKLGLVQSSQDLASVIQKTGAAHKAGQINDTDYGAQLKLLSQYKGFYGLQAAGKPQTASGGTP